MDLNISMDFFNPEKVNKDMHHVIGCGSIGSNVAELLVRQGVEYITLWDFDYVESHNIVNQLFTTKDINRLKTEALAKKLYDVNPNITLVLMDEGYKDTPLEGYVFLCVDNIETRKKIIHDNFMNPNIKLMTDFRTGLTEGQIYSIDWTNYSEKMFLKKASDFTHDEAKTNTPVSACGFSLSVAPVVRMTACQGIANYMNFVNKNNFEHFTAINPFQQNLFSM